MIILFFVFAVMISSCSQKPPEPENSLGDWLSAARLDAEETPEELYAAARNEGILVVYSTSTRMMDVAKSFEAHYEGLVVKVEHIREGELYDKLIQNYESGQFDGDVICSADGRGIMASELIPRGIVVKYVPYDIKDKLISGSDGDVLLLAGEAGMLQYNKRYYSEPPVNNWWELTEAQWRGKIYMPNPVRSMTTLAFFNMIIKNSDRMAGAYEDLYGQPLELPSGESAGREFIRRLVANDVVIVNSSDETAEIIGAPGSRSSSLGIMVSSKTRLQSLGYEMVNHCDMEPFCGVYTPINIMLVGGSKNVNAAKLFIRWILGEADGQGEGYKPYLQSGAWSVRVDVADNTEIRSEDLNLWYLDHSYLYENQEEFIGFWAETLKREE